MTYRGEYCRQHGIALLEERDTTVVIGAWNDVPTAVRVCLETVHRKRIIVEEISPDSPAAQLSAIAGPEERSPGAATIVEPDATDEGGHLPSGIYDRTHNLSPVELQVQRIVTHAVDSEATDVSIWKRSRRTWEVGMRRRGELQRIATMSPEAATRIVRFLIVRAGLELFDEQTPQDGLIVFPWLPGRRIRIATIGDGWGRYVALRFLARTPPPLTELGYRDAHVAAIRSAAAHRTGLIVFAGPTGAGKTTSIAALLTDLAAGRRKVVSLEDPVEYLVPGVVQIERTASTLRGDTIAAALRQDPDILAFGEIRRREHAEQLEEAVLSGHLVIARVHADSREGTSQRLERLGFSRELLAQRCRLIVYQHLHHNPPGLYAALFPEVQDSTVSAEVFPEAGAAPVSTELVPEATR